MGRDVLSRCSGQPGVCIHAESPARTGRDHTLHESTGLLSERKRGPGRSGLMFDKAAFLHPCHIYRQGEDGTGKRVFRQLLRLHIFPRGGNEQRFHIVAAKADLLPR